MKNEAIYTVLGGWVYVGSIDVKDGWVTLVKGSCIRRWGTSSGLRELIDGPLDGTTLDNASGVMWHISATGPIYPINREKWVDKY